MAERMRRLALLNERVRERAREHAAFDQQRKVPFVIQFSCFILRMGVRSVARRFVSFICKAHGPELDMCIGYHSGISTFVCHHRANFTHGCGRVGLF